MLQGVLWFFLLIHLSDASWLRKKKYEQGNKPVPVTEEPTTSSPGAVFFIMKHTKVLEINISHDELKDIRAAYEKMVAGLDINRMIAAMEALTPNRKTLLSAALLHQELEKCYKDIIEAWGPMNEDGSLDVDLLDYPSAGSGNLGFILNLKFDREKEGWLWTLNLEVSSNYVYPAER